MANKVVDELGLVLEGNYITEFIPATNSAFVFRVKSRYNKDAEVFNYGPLPLKSGETLQTFEAASVAVPADGVIPARAFNVSGKTFPLEGVYDAGDMWYLPKDYRERQFHVIQEITPAWLRIDVQIPTGVTQRRFQRDKIMLGVDKDFGFSRGRLEIVHFPEVHYGYRWGNDTNVSLYTFVRFTYGEYIVETPRDSELIFNILTRRIPSYWVTLPINSMDITIERALTETYGTLGFPVFGIHQRAEAIAKYEELLGKVKV